MSSAENLEKPDEATTAPQKALTWKVSLAFLFATFLVQPVIIYYYLISNQVMTIAAWIPIVLWSELANLLRARLLKQELFLLVAFHPILLAYSLFFLGLVRNTYFAYSEPSVFFGIANYIPEWFVPKGSDLTIVQGSPFFFFHKAWLIPIGMQVSLLFLGLIMELAVGYLCYQIFAVGEKLEFPLARAEVATVETLVERTPSLVRPLFLSALAGVVMHLAGKFLPYMMGLFMAGGSVIYFYEMPYFDLTPYLDNILPGAGFIIPLDPVFYVPGLLISAKVALCQFIAAFALYFVGGHLVTRLNLWPPESLWATGWGYWTLQYRSLLYFFVSLIIGVSLAAMAVPLALNPRPLVRGIRRIGGSSSSTGSVKGILTPKTLMLIYLGSSVSLALIVWGLTNFSFPIWLLLIFIVGGTFFANYIATASVGVTVLGVNVPFLREVTIFYSGYTRRDIWFSPIPLSMSGTVEVIRPASSMTTTPMGGSKFAQGFFQADILNVRHREYVKAFFILVALSLFSSFFFTSLFWFVARIPSSAYPATTLFWPVEALSWARLQVWVWFGYLFNLNWLALGFGVGSVLAAVTHFLKLPYSLPIFIAGMASLGIPYAFAQLMASFIAERFIARYFGVENWKRYRGLIYMGYIVGDGLMETIRVVVILASRSGWLLPF